MGRTEKVKPGPRIKGQLTEGPILRVLLTLAIPIILANVLQTVYQLIDTFWVGRLGAEAVAAVSLSFPILFLVIALGGGLAIAGAILTAQYYGKGESVDHIAAQTMLAVVGIALVLSVAGYLATPAIMSVFDPAPAVYPLAVEYLRISFLGLIFLYIYFVFQSLYRSVGDVRTPLYVVSGTVLLNFIADPLFILGMGPVPEMGVAGAAMATVAAQGIAAMVGLLLLARGRSGIRLRRAELVPDLKLMKRIVRLGAPASLEQSSRAVGFSVMMVLVAAFGTTAVASYGIATRVVSFIIIPGLGLSMATATVVGQNIGAGKPDRAEETARVANGVGLIALEAAGVVAFFFADPIIRVFIPESPMVIGAGATFLRIMALTWGFVGVQLTLTGTFRGAGNTVAAMALAILSLWILRFPVAWALSAGTPLGIAGIWWAFPVSNVFAAVIAYLWFRRGRWRRRALTDEDHAIRDAVTDEAIVEEGWGR